MYKEKIRRESLERRKQKIKRRKRRRQLIVKMSILGMIAIVLVGGCIVRGFVKEEQERKRNALQEKEEQERLKERLKEAEDMLKQCYLEHTGKEEAEFSKWFLEYYPEEIYEKILEASTDGNLDTTELYDLTGESIYVIEDRYHGLLENEEIAAENNIYIRENEEQKNVEIAIAGDLCFAEEGFVLDHFDTVNDLEKCISPEILEITNASDIFYVNHEYCISDRGEPLAGKFYTFRANPDRMELLKQMGTDIVSLANNHVFDYGKEALLNTTDLLEEAKIPYVGGGRNIEEAKRPIYFIVDGIKIGFVGASNGEKLKFTPQATETEPGILRAYDTAEYNQVIQLAAKECDYLIAYIHWGTEDTNYYNADQERWGREFLQSGADIVIGGHPHVLQGIEYVEGKPIIYSLGDFWFNHETKYTGVLTLNISCQGLEKMTFVPCLQTNFTTQYLHSQQEQEALYTFLKELSPNIEIDSQGIITPTVS